MIFFKRQFATFVLMIMGFLALIGNFINNKNLNDFIDKDATQWYEIIAGFAAFLGVLNLMKLHLTKISYKRKNWEYSILTLLSFFIMIFFGFFYNDSQVPFGSHLKDENSTFYWIFDYIYLPLASTMFALLAFFVASASYRAFRIRNFEATLLLVSGILLMIGRVPIGALIPWYVVNLMYVFVIFILLGHNIKTRRNYFLSFLFLSLLSFVPAIYLKWYLNPPAFLSIPLIQEWIFAVPATAGARAIMIGIALGTVAQSFRIITGREKTILGD